MQDDFEPNLAQFVDPFVVFLFKFTWVLYVCFCSQEAKIMSLDFVLFLDIKIPYEGVDKYTCFLFILSCIQEHQFLRYSNGSA